MLAGCSSGPGTKVSYALGTQCMQTIYEGDANAADAGEQLLYGLDATLSMYRDTSEVDKLNQSGGKPVKVSTDTEDVIKEALEVSKVSGGAFDISLGILTREWDFGGNPKVPDVKLISKLLPYVDYKQIEVKDGSVKLGAGQAIDLGGIAKGYAADRLAVLYREKGVKSAIINLGGNIYILGKKPDGEKFKVGIEDPLDTSNYFAWMELEDVSVVTSGAYEQYFVKDGKTYHHILDPKTGYPSESDILSVSVLSKNSMLADGLSTSVFVLGSEKGLELINSIKDVEAVIVTKDKKILVSDGFDKKYRLQLTEDCRYVEEG